MIEQQQTELSGQVLQLLGALRASKPYQYAPLYVAVCGSGSATEREFYLRLSNEQYG